MTGAVHSADVIAVGDDAVLTEINAAGRTGDHLGWVKTTAQGSRFVADGVPGPLFDRIVAGRFSHDGTRFCYAGVKAGPVTVLADHQPGPVVGNLSKQAPPSFSPDGRTLIYGATESGPYHLYIDHVPQADELAPIRPSFSADGKHLGWVAQKRGFMSGRQWAVIDGKAGPETRGLDTDIGIRFSPGGRHSVYVARFAKSFSIVRNDVVGAEFRNIGPLAFSPDGERLAAVVWQGDRSLLSLDGAAPQHDTVPVGPVFSPNSRRLAWLAKHGEQFTVMIDGTPDASVDDVHDRYGWRSDGQRFSYLAKTSGGWRLSTHGPDQPAFDAVAGFRLRSERPSEYATYRGRGPIFLGRRNGLWALVVDDEVGLWFEGI